MGVNLQLFERLLATAITGFENRRSESRVVTRRGREQKQTNKGHLMAARRYDLAVALVLMSGATAGTRADFVLTEAERVFHIDVDNGGGLERSVMTIPGFGLLDYVHTFGVPGASGMAGQNTTIAEDLISGSLTTTVNTDAAAFESFVQSSLEVRFDLDAPTTVSLFMTVAGSGLSEELTQGSFELARDFNLVFGSDGAFEQTVIDLQPGSYSLYVSIWTAHGLNGMVSGSATKVADFGFAVIPAPGALALLPLALACGRRRRRE